MDFQVYIDGSMRKFYGMKHHFEIFICDTSISSFFAPSLPNLLLPYFPVSALASQDTLYTWDFQLLMPKLCVNKALVLVSTTFTNQNKCTFPSSALCWIYRPRDRYCLLPQLHCSVSFLSQWSTGRKAPCENGSIFHQALPFKVFITAELAE